MSISLTPTAESHPGERLMKCGCVVNGGNVGVIKATGKPYCVQHDCEEWAKAMPNLAGRTAKCQDCRKSTTSSMGLPFFHHNPNNESDSYYCGCRGWD